MSADTNTKYLDRINYEIRSSLNSLLGMVELLWETPLNEEQSEYLGYMRQGAEHLLTTSADLCELAASDATPIPLSSEDLDLRNVLEEIAGVMEVLAWQKKLKLTARLDPRTPAVVRGDRERLTQVLSTLLHNAIQFTDAGEIWLETELDPAVPGSILFAVSDTGAGVKPGSEASLFDPFLVPEGQEYPECGVGLALAHRLASAMGGKLSYEPRPGGGSIFRFNAHFGVAGAPISVVQETAPDSTQVSSPAVKPPARILVVDDSEHGVFLIKAFLKDQPMLIDTAENGLIAVGKVEGQTYDAVLMDLEMPILDGYTATRMIRAHEVRQNMKPTPILALTAHTKPEEIARSLEAGCSAYLPKPVTKATLVQALRHHLADGGRESTAE